MDNDAERSEAAKRWYTPGPWVIRHDFNVFGADVIHGGSRLVASAGGHSNNVRPLEADEENRANAHLIAAAPELLEALKLAVDIADSWINSELGGTSRYESESEKLKPCYAAIAKAERR